MQNLIYCWNTTSSLHVIQAYSCTAVDWKMMWEKYRHKTTQVIALPSLKGIALEMSVCRLFLRCTGPSINPCRFTDVTCTFTWTLSKTRACAFPQTAWERWMDNTWKSLLDDGLDAGLMNNWLFTYQHFSAFFLLGLWDQRAEEKCHLSGRRALTLGLPGRVDFPGHSHALHGCGKFLSCASESVNNAA